MNQQIGIVIVSHNASTAVRITLASLREAKNETPSKVLLIDNASDDLEREEIRAAFERHLREAALPWEYLEQDKNLGFSGGNNVGIRHFLDDPEITGICLLNSDVVVTDHWLDYLVQHRCDIISAVTNKAESEQCVPIDYTFEFDQCLDGQTEGIPPKLLANVQHFAKDWHEAWAGNLVEADATFFCVLLTKQVIEKVGLLDETFFPGGYEDDDYCLRARQLGFRIHLARDVFIHHWGSASFGKLQYGYFNSSAQRNRDYLEKKHGIIWQPRHEKPFISYLMDLAFTGAQSRGSAGRQRFNALYIAQLGAVLGHFESEFRNLNQMLADSDLLVDLELRDKIDLASSFGDLTAIWQRVVAGTEAVFSHAPGHQSLADDLCAQLGQIAKGVRTRVECNFAMHALLFQTEDGPEDFSLESALPPTAGHSRLSKLVWLLKKGLPFLLKLRGIVFFGGYPYPERQSDGYFQRIQIVDGLFPEYWRVYVESGELPGHRSRWFDLPQPKVLVLTTWGGPRRRMLGTALVLLAVLKCRKIYFHSVLRMPHNGFGLLMHVPGLTKIIDIHGVVPEEFRFHNDFYSALLYERQERLAVRKSNLVVVVTEAMKNYLRQKYRDELKGQTTLFPMFPNIHPTLAARPYADGKPVVVYAGGLQKWQQVPKMVDAISRTASICTHLFYCPEPEIFRAMLPEAVRSQVVVDCKAHDELVSLYAECHYGFILREDIIVNHVACPTKLVEYLAMGIVPVVDCEDVGDFKAMGMQFLALEELLRGNLPSEEQRTAMAKQNFTIYERMREVRKQGAKDICSVLAGGEWQPTLLARIKKLFPPNTRQGWLTRSIWRGMKASARRAVGSVSLRATTEAEVLAQVIALVSPECDVLVQVDNFEAGGLENVVIDLNGTLIAAGHKVVLLVLGIAGASVQRARAQGIPVIVSSEEPKLYRELIKSLKPRLVLAHYSLHGAELCHELNIPFVQVIHNTYMWFDDAQRAAFANAARYTTIFVAVSEYAKRYSIRRLGIDGNSCLVIPNGIDNRAFDAIDKAGARQEIRARHGLSDSDFVFVGVGAINHQKNHIAAVRAFSAIAGEMPEAKLVILGPPYETGLLKEIRQWIAAQHLDGRVLYVGAVPGAQKYYAMADAFVSTAFFEGGPLNQLEALRANLPCVMTDVGFAGYFKDRPGCEIVPPPLDIAEFKGAIWQLASTPEFESRVATAMLKLYGNRQCPDLPAEVLDAFDKANAYRCYVRLVGDLLQGKDVQGKDFPDAWTNQFATLATGRSRATG
ncbi:MAG: glycosyltransferase [Methylovulum miyakonense]|uniref:glycosyltransferase n=1 Tax=Methylovulum miyakonense TaxID=645578 RepID=UPI003BB51147